MKKFLIKSLFALILLPIYFVIFLSISLISFEFLGISKLINHNVIDKKKERIYHLSETNYYKKDGLKQDPYSEFVKQVLHPTYFFSLPWDIEKIKTINNLYVSLNNDGFRNSLNFENKKNGVILLGGSFAFSHGSSSDNTTISSYLSEKTKYNSINRAVPSWNSHQEMLSLIKYKNDFKYVVSLSSGNDFSITCSNSFNYSKILDIPESFQLINDYFYDIRDKSVIKLSTSIKKFLIFNFPETKKIYKHIKFLLTKKDKKNTSLINDISKTSFCGGLKNIDKLVENFLHNQNIIRIIAKENNAEHWLIIQPQRILHAGSNSNYPKIEIELRKYYRDKIMSSDFCKLRCLDYSNLYENYFSDNYTLFPDKRDINWPEKAILYDNFHVTDLGNEILADNLINDVKFK